MRIPPDSPKRLLKRAERKAAKESVGKGWTKEQYEHRIKVWYRRLEEKQQRGEL